jgi:hypothetical protein
MRFAPALVILAFALAVLWAAPAVAVTPGVTLVVDTTSDASLTACTAALNDCSYRGALTVANGTPSTIDMIVFDIGTGVPAIQPVLSFPSITAPVIIDGHSGGADRVNLLGSDFTATDGVRLVNHTGSTISGLVINGWDGDGIEIDGGGGHTIANSLIGTNSTGTAAYANSGRGINVVGSNDNTIGKATSLADVNVISGNFNTGVAVDGDSSGNTFRGNLIGLGTGGTTVPNMAAGIELDGHGNTIGGNSDASRNYISGNVASGIYLYSAMSHDNVIKNNYIGTDANGTAAAPNYNGILVEDAPNNQIGEPGHGNVISGSTNAGIYLQGAGAHDNTIAANFIGTNTGGDAAVPNDVGIELEGAPNNTIGQPGARNVISGNAFLGVYITTAGASGNTVQSNYIGVGANGSSPLGNGFTGLLIGEAADNLIGGEGAGNVIAKNLSYGVSVSGSPAVRNTISQNSIYDNPLGAIDLDPQGPDGIDSLDVDTGANNGQNKPQILSASSGSTHLRTIVQSNPNTHFTLEFFYGPQCAIDGFYEGGKTFIGSALVTSDDEGVAIIDTDFDVTAPEGSWITATQTHEDGSTSEFSNCIAVVYTPPTPTPIPTATPVPTATPTPRPTHTPRPTASPTPTPTPTATPSGKTLMGDLDCDDDIDPVDSLGDLRHVAALSPVQQHEPCPDIGAPNGDHTQGDLDCDNDVDPVDALADLRHVAGLSPLAQHEPCPDVGTQA